MHWGGYPCDLQELWDIAQGYGIPLIEDAAHAFGSTYRDTIIGDCVHSDYTTFSFQAIKTLTTVDGGALFCKDRNTYAARKLLRWYGIDREGSRHDMRCEDDIRHYGYKYHLNDVCATIGLENLKYVDKNLQYIRSNARWYMDELKDVPGVTLMQTGQDRTSSWWMFTILVDDRPGFCRMMGEKGVMVSRVHERNDKHSCVARFKRNDLYGLEYVIDKMICLPVGWWVTLEDRGYITDCAKGGW